MLKASNIIKSYGDIQVLRGINLEVQKGDIASIVGASGAGKSTLLHLLGTLDAPDQGLIEINNKNVSALSVNELASFRNKEIGFVFQFHNLLPEFTALENVCIPGFIGTKNPDEVRRRGEELLELMGLGHRMEHKPAELSGGEQQRVSVARALINNPSIIFADEPSGNLDSKNAKELHELFFDLRTKFNQTFVIVTHNTMLAEKADYTFTIKDGVIEK